MGKANAENQYDDIDELDALFSEAQDEAVDVDTDERANAEEEQHKEETQSVEIDADELSDLDEDLTEAESHEPASKPPVEKKEKKQASSKKSSAPRFSSGESLVDYGLKVLDGKPLFLSTEDSDENEEQITQSNLERLEAVQAVKVRDKLANVIAAVARGKALSVYTASTIKLLAKGQPVTKADIRNNLLDLNIGMGTASSQAGQMTHLVQALKLAEFRGGKFHPLEESVMAALYGEDESEDDSSEDSEGVKAA